MSRIIEGLEILDVPGVEAQSLPPIARPFSALVRPQRNDPSELLQCRFLCRQGTLLLCGPTGIGKSSLALQLAILWAAGKEFLGIRPTQPLKSLLVQAENDDGDLVEMRDGIIAGLGQGDYSLDNVLLVREDERTGFRFLEEVVRPLLATHKPDLCWLDPVLSYLGGESNSQRDVGSFLRNGLNPLLRQFDCGCVIVHHTNKPPTGKEKQNWQGADFAYLGAGSAEWANHARAVLALRSTGSRMVFELQAAKRGARLGWRDIEGQPAFARSLAHWHEPGVVCWREATPNEVETSARPKSNREEIIRLLPAGGLKTGEWEKLAKEECGVSRATFHRERQAFEKAGRVLKSKISCKWQRIDKA
jgi:hypothetical protein